MRYLFNEKVITQGYILSIQSDLEWRISVSKKEIISDETLKEKMEIINNHVLLLNKIECFIEELCEQNTKYKQDESERLQRTERLQAKDL